MEIVECISWSSFSSLTQMPLPQCCWASSCALWSLEQVRWLLRAVRLSSRPEWAPSPESTQQLSLTAALFLHTQISLLPAGFFISGMGVFSNYWSLGQILPHMPQQNNTARTDLRPLLMLRTAIYGKYTRHGTRMCFKRPPTPQNVFVV